ncbi:MAG: hypothetical protein EAY81_05465 [Bacteroidetes bacterium]|nr:MAG: hypothetical protein EAY81_05465 [Bacteroidota bacterium]
MRAVIHSIFLLGLLGVANAQDTTVLFNAKQFINKRDFQHAVILLDEYIKNHQEDTLAQEWSGDAYVGLSLYQQAEQHYSQAMLYCKSNHQLIRKHAIVLFLLNEYRAAKEQWQLVCKNDPDNKQNWYYLALVYSKTREHKKAVQALNKALLLDAIYIEARILRADINLKEQQYKEVLVDVDTALKIVQYTDELFINRGLALFGLKRYQEASQMFERVIKRNEKNVHAWFGLANVQYSTKLFDEAIVTLSKAITLSPTFELAYFKRGMAQLEVMKTEEGCKDLLKSASLGYADAIYYVQKYCNGVK